MIHGDACFAYFNKIWGISSDNKLVLAVYLQPVVCIYTFPGVGHPE